MPTGEIKATLERAKRVLVVSHIDPDGDALGTQLAFGEYLRSLGKEVILARDSAIPDKYAFLPDVDTIVPVSAMPDDIGIDTAVILECPTLDRTGGVKKYLSGDVILVNIDHHQDSASFGAVNWINVGASSVGEMAYEYLTEVGFDISRKVATDLYTAILTDTGRFRFPSTTKRTMIVAGDLIALGADPRTICDQVYYNMQPTTMLLTGRVLNSMEYHNGGRICLLTLTRRMLVETGARESESDGLVDFTLFTQGVVTGALLKEIDPQTTKVSLRSNNGVNVSEIAARFGGGGHVNASGCHVPLPLNEAKAEIVAALKEADGLAS